MKKKKKVKKKLKNIKLILVTIETKLKINKE